MGVSPGLTDGFAPTADQWNGLFVAKADDLPIAIGAPSSGGTITTGAGTGGLLIMPSTGLTSLTVVLPPAPIANQQFWLATPMFSIAVLSITSADATVVGGSLALAATAGAAWVYDSTTNTWYPIRTPAVAFGGYSYTQVQSVSSGGTITAIAGVQGLRIRAPAELTSLSVVMPVGPVDAQPFELSTLTTIDSLNMSSIDGSTIDLGTGLTLPAGGGVAWQYLASNTVWARRFFG